MESESTFDVVKRLMLDRRSVRKYMDKEIPMEELKEVIALAQERRCVVRSRIEGAFFHEYAALQGCRRPHPRR